MFGMLRVARVPLGCLASAILLVAGSGSGQGLCPEGVLQAPAPGQEARCGWSVALDGTTAVVAAPFATGAAPLSGAVFVFERTSFGWVQTATLVASDGLPGDGFGNEVALAGDRLAIGAVWRDGPGIDAGAVYVFERTAGTWSETALLVPSDHADHDWFGRAVDVDGARIAVGASLKLNPGFAQGAAYVFDLAGGVWSEKAKLKASDGAADDFFGGALDLDGSRLLVGAHGGDALAPESGGAYVFELAGGVWSEADKLTAPDGQANDDLGIELALEGDTALLASFGDDGAAPEAGSLYVFQRGAGGWSVAQELFASDAQPGDGLGSGVALDGDVAVCGAQHAGQKAGAVYAFRRAGGLFHEEAKLAGAPAAALLGFDVAVSGDLLLGGAPESSAVLPFAGEARPARLTAGASLFGCPAWLSLAAGGGQALTLDAGPAFGGDLYWVAGTAHGPVPGFAFGGLAVPLNPDGYFLFTVAHPGVPPLFAGLGALDAGGRALAGFGLPPGYAPSLAGTTLHHAALVLDPSTLTAGMATVAAPLALAP